MLSIFFPLTLLLFPWHLYRGVEDHLRLGQDDAQCEEIGQMYLLSVLAYVPCIFEADRLI